MILGSQEAVPGLEIDGFAMIGQAGKKRRDCENSNEIRRGSNSMTDKKNTAAYLKDIRWSGWSQ